MEPLIKQYTINASLEEDVVWADDIAPWLPPMTKNAKDIWFYAFTEMFNNALDHSGGGKILVSMQTMAFEKHDDGVNAIISDDGVGIFNKIQKRLRLSDPRHAALELAKGKFTTDSDNHSGEGVFFTSRMMDLFAIFSGPVYFSHRPALDWIETRPKTKRGTHVVMYLRNDNSRTCKEVFDEFATEDGGFKFNKTFVPVRLAQYGDDKLVSRSQAKRLVAGLDKFDYVVLDFSKVNAVGQAFADEVFRAFANRHPQIKLNAFGATPEVKRMINRARRRLS